MKIVFLCIPCLCLLSAVSTSAEFYRWVDEKGTVHFSDNGGRVPESARDSVTVGGLPPRDSGEGDDAANSSDDDRPDGDSEKRFEIPYLAAGRGGEQRVIIPVTFNNRITAPMAVDTGAPGLVLFKGLADRLGMFDTEEGRIPIVTGGIGGQAPGIRTIIDSVRVGGATDTFVPTTVLLTSVSNSFEGLVGMDFMSRYSMQIDPTKQRLIFQELPGNGDRPGGHDERWWRRNFKEFGGLKRQWQGYMEELKVQEARFEGPDARKEQLRALRDSARGWYREATRMYDRLVWYATDCKVPLHWREQ